MLAIRLLRTMKGITSRELARRLGVPASTWHRMERGLRPIPQEILERVARELSVSPADLRGTDGGSHE